MLGQSHTIQSKAISRRRLMQWGLASAAVGSMSGERLSWSLERGEPTADQLVVGKDRRLIVHNASKSGFEIETPLDLLKESSTTPLEQLFVRNNQQPDWSATLAAPAPGPWKLEIGGLTEFPRTISLEELKGYPHTEHELVLQCSGNGRALFGAAAPVKGAPWKHGAMGNVRFKGVPLRLLFEKLNVRPHVAAKFLTAEGADAPAKPDAADFEHSLPLVETLDRAIIA